MTSKVFDIALLAIVFGSGIFGVYYSIKLRLKSNSITMKAKEQEDKDILRIFDEMEKKAREINSDLIFLTQEHRENQQVLDTYQEFIYTNTDSQTVTVTSNQVTV